MAEVTVYDATRMKAIEDSTVVNGEIDPVTGHLMLTRFDETVIDAGLVNVSPRVVTSGTRPVTGLFDGLVIYETDTDRFYVYNGVGWVPRGQGYYLCTAATRPAHMDGLMIYETDTKRVYVSDGTTWQLLGPHMPHTSLATVTPTGAITTSATFVNLGVDCVITNFIKYRSDTKIQFLYTGAVYNDDSSGLGTFEVAVQFNGVDTKIQDGLGTDAGTGCGSGQLEFSGIPAGTYTARLRKRRPSGAGNVRDSNAVTFPANSLRMTETF